MEQFKGLTSALYVWSESDAADLEANVQKISEVIGTASVENIDRLSQSKSQL